MVISKWQHAMMTCVVNATLSCDLSRILFHAAYNSDAVDVQLFDGVFVLGTLCVLIHCPKSDIIIDSDPMVQLVEDSTTA